jgi:hypothetical protein
LEISLHLHRTMNDRAPLNCAQRSPQAPRGPTVSILSLNHAREISLSLHPSTGGRFAAPRHPRAGLGDFPLHLPPNHERTSAVQSRSGAFQAPRDPWPSCRWSTPERFFRTPWTSSINGLWRIGAARFELIILLASIRSASGPTIRLLCSHYVLKLVQRLPPASRAFD